MAKIISQEAKSHSNYMRGFLTPELLEIGKEWIGDPAKRTNGNEILNGPGNQCDSNKLDGFATGITRFFC